MSEIDLMNEYLSKLDELIDKLNERNLSFIHRQQIIRALLFRIALYYLGIAGNINKITIDGKSIEGEKIKITLE